LWDIRQPVRTLVEDNVQVYYQEMIGEDIEDFMCAAITMIFRACKPVRLLQVLVVTICKWSTNPFTNSNLILVTLIHMSEVVGLDITVRSHGPTLWRWNK
jgi:hypothetical protein